MREVHLKCFVKMGTALRYLIDAREGQPLGGKHILSNIEAVLEIIPELEFTATVDTGGYRQLQALFAELRARSTTETRLRAVDAGRLETVCRKIREALISEGGTKVAYFLTPEEVATLEAAESPRWPDRVTLSLLLETPWSVASWFVGLLIAAFVLGTTLAELEILDRLMEIMASSGGGPGDSLASQPGS